MRLLRYAVRGLRTNPGFAVPAILTLGLGIGGVTAIFSVVDCVLLRPLPYPEASRLISVTTYLANDRVDFLVSTEYLNWARDNRVLESFAAIGANGPGSMIEANGATRIGVARVTTNFLATLRVPPVLGRDFLPEEGRTGGDPAALLSYDLWQTRFGGEPGAIGKPVNIDGAVYRVAGILPRESLYLPSLRSVDVLLPLQIAPEAYSERGRMGNWQTVGRLKPGVSIEQARANFTTLFAATRLAVPRLYAQYAQLRVVPYQDRITGGVRLVLLLLLGAVGCVLLIACANVANLLLARGVARRKELAVRAALGASRARLVRQLLVESAVLAAVGGAAGTGIAFAVVRLVRAAPQKLPRIAELTIDLRVLFFAFLLSLATAVFFGLIPALSASRIDLKGWTRRSALRGVLVSAELALSFTLLVSAALLVQSLWRLQHKSLGFNPDSLLLTNISLRGSRFEQNAATALFPELRDRAGRLPGTLSVALADGLPPGGGCCGVRFVREGVPPVPNSDRGGLVVLRNVSTSYFATVGIPLQRGRLFAEGDRDVAVINQALARRFFPGEDPIGIRIGVPPKRIVAVVA